MDITAIRTLKEKIEFTENQLVALREMAQSVTTSKTDGLPSSQAFTSKVERLATKIITVEEELSRLRIELLDTADALTRLINQRVKGKAAIVLLRRYVLLESFKVIALTLKLSESSVLKLHQQGVRNFSDKNL